MSLTDSRIRKAEIGVRPYRLFDREGLYLHIMPTGTKIWRFKYNYANKEKLLSFDVYPTVSLPEARERVFEAMQLLSRNIDPSTRKREEKLTAIYKANNTFQDIAFE